MFRRIPEVVEPEVWILAFHRTTPHWWLRWLAWGRYRHVSAFAWVPDLRLWLVYDVSVARSRIVMLPEGPNAVDRIADLTADADLLRVPIRVRPRARWPPLAPFSCVSAVSHLIGVGGGALRPDALWRHCRAAGAEIVHGTTRTTVTGAEPADLAGAGASES